jgi:hypothetical protein
MKPGDIVELKSGHGLKEYFPCRCVILDAEFRRFRRGMECRYLISTIAEREEDRNLTWAYEGELVPISEMRDSALRKLGI